MSNIVITVVDDFGFNNGNKAGLLTGFGVFGESVAVLMNGFVGGGENVATWINTEFKGGTPFGETETHLVVFGEARVEIVETFGDGFEGIGVEGG